MGGQQVKMAQRSKCVSAVCYAVTLHSAKQGQDFQSCDTKWCIPRNTSGYFLEIFDPSTFCLDEQLQMKKKNNNKW